MLFWCNLTAYYLLKCNRKGLHSILSFLSFPAECLFFQSDLSLGDSPRMLESASLSLEREWRKFYLFLLGGCRNGLSQVYYWISAGLEVGQGYQSDNLWLGGHFFFLFWIRFRPVRWGSTLPGFPLWRGAAPKYHLFPRLSPTSLCAFDSTSPWASWFSRMRKVMIFLLRLNSRKQTLKRNGKYLQVSSKE